MKKFLSLLSIITILGMTPTFAAPMGPGPGGPAGPRGGQPVHAGMNMPRPHHGGPHVPPPPPPRHVHHRGGSAVIGGVFARPGCWYYPSYSYYGLDRYRECDYRPVGYSHMYVNFGIPIRF